MSDAEEPKGEPAKPSRLSGLVAPKGVAARPAEQLQRALEPVTPPAAPVVAMGSKSLTLRLPGEEYERLRAYAYASRKTHQTILAEALKAHLDAMT